MIPSFSHFFKFNFHFFYIIWKLVDLILLRILLLFNSLMKLFYGRIFFFNHGFQILFLTLKSTYLRSEILKSA